MGKETGNFIKKISTIYRSKNNNKASHIVTQNLNDNFPKEYLKNSNGK
jgi:hypothetical protein